ncbi:putative C6 zinc finger domain-containing protein [Neofusicoccum parvum]|nr:putative C6 zinc finger domain-containing protein [Neofusicoccum parvum]
MSTRKPHTKSRRGCAECKRRHNKCDEVHPTCSSCRRLGVSCVWPDVVQPAGCTHANRSAAAAPSKKRRASQYLQGLEDINRKLPWPCLDDAAGPAFTAEDMQLLHQYSTTTHATFDTAPAQFPLWQHAVVRIGFAHRFVLRGVLALSALHLAAAADASERRRASWIASSSVNFNVALQEFRGVLEAGVTAANCPAVFLFSTTVAVHAMAIGQVQLAVDPVADMVQCMQMSRGVTTIVRPFWDALLASDVEPLVSNALPSGARGCADDILRLKELVAAGDWADGEDTVYGEVIDHLVQVAREARGRPSGSPVACMVFSWPALIPDAFLGFLSERRPVAMVILLHFTAFMQESADLWWLCRWHKRVKECVEISLPPDLFKWIPE